MTPGQTPLSRSSRCLNPCPDRRLSSLSSGLLSSTKRATALDDNPGHCLHCCKDTHSFDASTLSSMRAVVLTPTLKQSVTTMRLTDFVKHACSHTVSKTSPGKRTDSTTRKTKAPLRSLGWETPWQRSAEHTKKRLLHIRGEIFSAFRVWPPQRCPTSSRLFRYCPRLWDP